MAYGLMTTISGPNISNNLGLTTSQNDYADTAASAFGDRLLTRIDPRDVVKTTDRPTGAKRVHEQMPNRDPLLFTGSGISVEAISGKYAGKEVFKTVATGTAAAGTHNDLACGPKSLNGKSEFSIFGVAHFEASMLGSGSHFMTAMYRDRSSFETVIIHQYVSGVNYLSIFSDQASGGGVNHVLDGSATFTAGTPFAYLYQVYGSADNSTIKLFINNTITVLISGVAKNTPESGSMELFLGHGTADNNQWTGGFGRHYIIQGDCLDTADNQAASLKLMQELKLLYGIP